MAFTKTDNKYINWIIEALFQYTTYMYMYTYRIFIRLVINSLYKSIAVGFSR